VCGSEAVVVTRGSERGYRVSSSPHRPGFSPAAQDRCALVRRGRPVIGRATTRAHPLPSSKAHALGDTPASESTLKSTAGDEEPLAAGPSVVQVNLGRGVASVPNSPSPSRLHAVTPWSNDGVDVFSAVTDRGQRPCGDARPLRLGQLAACRLPPRGGSAGQRHRAAKSRTGRSRGDGRPRQGGRRSRRAGDRPPRRPHRLHPGPLLHPRRLHGLPSSRGSLRF
jgi:hypothetical protein